MANEIPKSGDSYKGVNYEVSRSGSHNAQSSAGHHRYSNPSHNRQNKAGSKRGPNDQVSHYPPMTPHLYPPMVPSPIPPPGYGFPHFPPPFPGVENQMYMPFFVPPGHGFDFNRNIQQPPRQDPNVYGANFSNPRPNAHEYGIPSYPASHYPQPYPTRHFARPPFFGPTPGFGGGPRFPGPAASYYVPPGALVSNGAQVFVPPGPRPMNATTTTSPSEEQVLMENIMMQIDYYFSDSNFPTDVHLISLMDAQGWVPISAIADFRRVKLMSTDIKFILKALGSSRVVEVQGERVRKRGDLWKSVARSSSRV